MFRLIKPVFFIFSLTCSIFAVAQAKSTTAPKAAAAPKSVAATPVSEETVNSFLHWMFGQEAALQWKIESIKPASVPGLTEVDAVLSAPQGKQQMVLYVGSDGKQAFVGDLIPFGADPFAADREKLKKFNGIVLGPADAPMTIVEFSDLQCPHCKLAHPVIEKLLADEPGARFVFQNFPLPMHNWAAKGAAYADCVGRKNPELLMKFIGAVFENQENITEATAEDKLKEAATKAGADAAAMSVCAALPATTTRVQQSVEFAKDMEVNSTPTVFINGRRIGNIAGAPYDAIKGIADFHMKEMQGKK